MQFPFKELLPRPRTVQSSGEIIPLKAGLSLKESFAGETFHRRIPCLLAGALERSETGLPVFVREGLEGAENREAFRLAISPEKIEINAVSVAGAANAFRTLRQLALYSGGSALPLGVIRDFPTFPHRAYMLDVSRCQVPTLAELYRWVDWLSLFKYNQLQLYVEHTFAWTGHETVWGDASPLTPEDIRSLDLYCADRYIELVPNLNCFGHYERWIRHPEYHGLAIHPASYTHENGMFLPNGTTLQPDAQSVDFVGGLIDEYAPLFTSRKINVGGDEPWDLGRGRSEKICREKGKHRVYLDYMNGIFKRARSHAGEVLFWADVVFEKPEYVAEIPDGLIPVIWGYDPESPFDTQCPQLENLQRDYWVAPSVRAFRSLVSSAWKWPNLPRAAIHGARHGASGYLVTDWGDRGHHQRPFASWPGLIWGGACAWNPEEHEEEPDLATAINQLLAEDASEATGQLVLGLARASDLLKLRSGDTAFFKFLFSPLQWIRNDCDDFRGEPIRKAEAHLEYCRSLLSRLQPRSGDANILKEELSLMTELVSLGLLRGKCALDPSPGEAVIIRQRLKPAILEFERLWMARARPGGLHESSGYLRESFDSLAAVVSGWKGD